MLADFNFKVSIKGQNVDVKVDIPMGTEVQNMDLEMMDSIRDVVKYIKKKFSQKTATPAEEQQETAEEPAPAEQNDNNEETQE